MNAHFSSGDYIEPPRAIEAEQALLGAILNEQSALDRVRGIVEPDDFSEGIHAAIYQTMCDSRDVGGNIDRNLIRIAIGNHDLGGATVGGYLASLHREASTIINAPDYAKAVRSAAMMRRLIATSQDAVAAMSTGAVADPSKYAAQMIQDLDVVASSGLADSLKRISLGNASTLAIDAAIAARDGRVQRGAPFGIPSLDHMTLGMCPGQMIVVAGRPGMGKTSAGVSIALNAAKAGHGVYFVSLEMVAQELGQRALAAEVYGQRPHGPISYREIAKGRDLTERDLYDLLDARDTLNSYPLVIEQQSGLSISQIAARARQTRSAMERKGQRLSVIVIDHIGLVAASKRYAGNRVQEMTEITTAIKVLAKELDVAIVALSQLNRKVEERAEKRPVLSDLRDSGSIEQDADMVLGLYREAYYLEHKAELTDEDRIRLLATMDTLEMEILKQRQGPTGRINLFCKIDCNAINELAGA